MVRRLMFWRRRRSFANDIYGECCICGAKVRGKKWWKLEKYYEQTSDEAGFGGRTYGRLDYCPAHKPADVPEGWTLDRAS